MNSGFWLSAAVLALGVAVAAVLLPDEVRADQVERDDDDKPSDAPHPDADAVVVVPEVVLA